MSTILAVQQATACGVLTCRLQPDSRHGAGRLAPITHVCACSTDHPLGQTHADHLCPVAHDREKHARMALRSADHPRANINRSHVITSTRQPDNRGVPTTAVPSHSPPTPSITDHPCPISHPRLTCADRLRATVRLGAYVVR